MMLHNCPITLSEKRVIAKDTIELSFVVPGNGIIFEAGQYISLEIPSLNELSVPERYHDFSLVSSPSSPKEISIVFRVSSSRFKIALLDIPIGGTVNIDGPKGVLTLPDKTDDSLVFVAGGGGIAPVLSMIRYATEVAFQKEIKLFYCNTSIETTAYHSELLALEKKNPLFSLHEAFGVPNEALFAPYIKEKQGAIWYVVGGPAMVKNVQQILSGFGILDSQVRIEEFSGYGRD